jgi:hypothetical protein
MKIKFGLLFLFSQVFFASNSYAHLKVEEIGKALVLTLDLNSDSIDYKKPMKFRSEDGQFEVRLKRDKFPIAAPNCKSSIIARMPSTIQGNKVEIDAKKKLFDMIDDLKTKPEAKIQIKVDIKPYAKIKQLDPFIGELKYCNVFFAPL